MTPNHAAVTPNHAASPGRDAKSQKTSTHRTGQNSFEKISHHDYQLYVRVRITADA